MAGSGTKREQKTSAGAKPRGRGQGDGAGDAPVRAHPPGPRCVVALGASAGGLEPLKSFFEHLPDETGLAFVVVTHQHAGHLSLMAELLARKTGMPVLEITEPTRALPDHVYTAHPGHYLDIANGVLEPRPLDEGKPYLPVDHFFRALAEDQGERAVGIVLSGTGSDGAMGVEAIKAELGMVMAQDEATAECDGMPRSAVATRLVDHVLPVFRMPARLLQHAQSLPAAPAGTEELPRSEILREICAAIRKRTGHDFSHYKPSSLNRRILRRLQLHRLRNFSAYVGYLEENPDEVEALFRDLLIGVTSFFRDPAAWEALGKAVSELLSSLSDDHVVRAWVPGCSTGEEAYSLAILLRECMDASGCRRHVQIFATDLDAEAIDVARQATYSEGIAGAVSSERLARFFTEDAARFRVKKEIRELIVFAPQNVLADPPFTKLDVLVCRNLLIYMDATIQSRLIPLFHYSLNAGGLLFLGSSESPGSFAQAFSVLDKDWKIYERGQAAPASPVRELPAPRTDVGEGRMAPVTELPRPRTMRLEPTVNQMLLDSLVPPTVLVREHGEVVHVHGRTGLFLEPAEGSQSTANIFNMARPGLQLSLSSTIREASTSNVEVVQRGVRVQANGGFAFVDVRVMRLTAPEPLRGLLRVSFERSRYSGPQLEGDERAPHSSRTTELELELQHAREVHQRTIQELETANGELQSMNEELHSTNEELQSANEELESSKEEMQSLNEELQAVNVELQDKVEELSSINNDMKNLLNGTEIATIFLDGELRIKRYTERAKRVIRLIPSDVGRSIGDLVSTLHYDRLVGDASEVLKTLVFHEAELRGQDGEWYLMRILPYRTTENVIDGLVITFVDVTMIKTLQEERARWLYTVKNSPVSLFEQNRELRYTWTGSRVFGRPHEEVVGRSDAELLEPPDAERVSAVKTRALESGRGERCQLQIAVDGAQKTFDLYVEPKRDDAGLIVGVSGVAVDLTPRA